MLFWLALQVLSTYGDNKMIEVDLGSCWLGRTSYGFSLVTLRMFWLRLSILVLFWAFVCKWTVVQGNIICIERWWFVKFFVLRLKNQYGWNVLSRRWSRQLKLVVEFKRAIVKRLMLLGVAFFFHFFFGCRVNTRWGMAIHHIRVLKRLHMCRAILRPSNPFSVSKDSQYDRVQSQSLHYFIVL